MNRGVLVWGVVLGITCGCAHAQGVELPKVDHDILAAVHFKLNSAELSEKARAALDATAEKLAAMPEPVEVAGHTDNSGPESFNENLSWQRAQSVVQYLVERGVAAKRLSPVGYRDSQPVDSNDTKYGRWRNRRVELRVPG
jgi:OOP family OmpA-OmpF porin